MAGELMIDKEANDLIKHLIETYKEFHEISKQLSSLGRIAHPQEYRDWYPKCISTEIAIYVGAVDNYFNRYSFNKG